MKVLEDASKAVNLKTGIPEWRAADRFLERLDDRFILKGDVNVNVGVINGAPNEIVDAAREAFLRQATPQPVVSCGVQSKAIDVQTIPPVQSVEAPQDSEHKHLP